MAKLGKLACVTGGNGFVGSSLVKLLLQCGYRVRATCRNPEAASKLEHMRALKQLGDLEIFAGDLMVPGSFDQAVATCDYVFHVACPVNLGDGDPENNLIQPAVLGTLNLLTSCVKAGTVKRVVLTSSGAAVSVNRLQGSGLILDETAWSDVEYLKAEKPPMWGYLVGKTEGEMAAWKFAEKNKLDLIVVNPVAIVGPSLAPNPPTSVRHALSYFSGLHLSLSLSLSLSGGLNQGDAGDKRLEGPLKTKQMVTGSISMVHIEDVCRAQVYLAESETASGRYILSPVNSGVAELAKFLATRYTAPESASSAADPGGALPGPKLALSSAKLVGEGFQFKYGNLEDIYDDLIKYGSAVGLLPVAAVNESLKTPTAADG